VNSLYWKKRADRKGTPSDWGKENSGTDDTVPCLLARVCVADPDPGYAAFLTTGSGIEKIKIRPE
jgi:hypothetical protein